MINAIIFDFGGVLIDFREEYYYKYLSKKYNINYNLLKKTFNALLSKMELGDMKLDELLIIISKKFNITKNQIEWSSSFKKMAKRNNKMINLVKKLRKNYKIYLLSNISKTRYLEGLKDFLKEDSHIFNEKFASCYIHLRKPDKKIYKYVLEKIKLNAKETIFIDDRIENITSANSVGMHGIKFTDYNTLILKLKKEGIKI